MRENGRERDTHAQRDLGIAVAERREAKAFEPARTKGRWVVPDRAGIAVDTAHLGERLVDDPRGGAAAVAGRKLTGIGGERSAPGGSPGTPIGTVIPAAQSVPRGFGEDRPMNTASPEDRAEFVPCKAAVGSQRLRGEPDRGDNNGGR